MSFMEGAEEDIFDFFEKFIINICKEVEDWGS